MPADIKLCLFSCKGYAFKNSVNIIIAEIEHNLNNSFIPPMGILIGFNSVYK